jgi:hypothetical protein
MSTRKLEVTVTRMQVLMALAVLKNVKVPGAFLLGKVEKHITTFLEKWPQDKFRLTAEAIDDATETKEVVTHGEAKEA